MQHQIWDLYINYPHRRNFELYWDPSQYLIIDEQTIGFQGRQKDKVCIKFRDSCGGLHSVVVCDFVYAYSFIYRNDYTPDSNIIFVRPVRDSFVF